MSLELRGRTISYPQLLVFSLTVLVALSVLVAASTTTSAFGLYNAAWDGASDLRETADSVGTDADVVLNTTTYETTTPNQTVAIVLSPDERYTPQQQARLTAFVKAGGTLLVAEDFGPQGNALLRGLGIESRFDGHLLRDERHHYRSPALPIATNVTTTPLTEDVDHLTLNYGTAIRNDTTGNATVLVRSSEFAYLDRNRNEMLDANETLRERPVVVRESLGNGTVIVASDPSMFINVMLERPGNQAFVRNLLANHERVLLDYSHHSAQPPLRVALLLLRKSPLLQIILGLTGLGLVLGLARIESPHWTRIEQVIGRQRRDSRQPVNRAALRAYLIEHHPEWDSDRIDRVMTGVLTQGGENKDDE